MIETTFQTEYGVGRVLIYNKGSARFWASAHNGQPLTINRVEHSVDFQIGLKDDGTWDIGYYEEKPCRQWRRSFVDIKRADWVHSDKSTSSAAYDKANELVQLFCEFIRNQPELLAEAEQQHLHEEIDSLEAKIVEKRAEIEEMLKQQDALARRAALTKCAVPDCKHAALKKAGISINGSPKREARVCQMHAEAAMEDTRA